MSFKQKTLAFGWSRYHGGRIWTQIFGPMQSSMDDTVHRSVCAVHLGLDFCSKVVVIEKMNNNAFIDSQTFVIFSTKDRGTSKQICKQFSRCVWNSFAYFYIPCVFTNSWWTGVGRRCRRNHRIRSSIQFNQSRWLLQAALRSDRRFKSCSTHIAKKEAFWFWSIWFNSMIQFL